MSIRFYQPAKQLTPRVETRAAVTNLSTIKMFDTYAPLASLNVDASSISSIPVVETPATNLDFLVYRQSVGGIAWEPFAPGPQGVTGMTGPGGVTGPSANLFDLDVETVTAPASVINPDVAVTFLNTPGADFSTDPVRNGQIKIIVNTSASVPVPVTNTNRLIISNGLNIGLLQFNALGSVAKLVWSSYVGAWILLATNNVSVA